MRVKICGITSLADALDAINAGADALGFVFYDPSPRYIRPIDAKKIVEKLPPFVQTVGLFVNESSKHINDICHVAHMQLAQIIDDEDTTEFDNLEVKYVKVARLNSKDDLEEIGISDDFIRKNKEKLLPRNVINKYNDFKNELNQHHKNKK